MTARAEQLVDVGALNRRIQIQQQTPGVRDSLGAPSPAAFTTAYTAWASIDVMTAQLLNDTTGFISQATSRITIRYTTSVIFNVGDQIVYTEATTGVVHTYRIKAVINREQRNRQIMFLCYELNAQE
jgi:head-tail adaptor